MFLLNKHPLVQKIDKVYVNIKTREFSLRFSDRQEKIFSALGVGNKINETDFELIRDIINKRYDAVEKD